MRSHWYSRQGPNALYDQPRATALQIEHARSLIKEAGSIPLDDYDGHVGAFTMIVDHLRRVAADPPDRSELMRRFRTIASRPSFDTTNPKCPRPGRRHWAWIDPRSIARGRVLGKPFPRGQYSPSWMADLAQEILDKYESPHLYSRQFNDPRYGYVICVSSIAGPLGPIRPIGTNGNHRSMAFDALECPLVLVEIYEEIPPYQITYIETDDDWKTTRDFLKWQEERGGLRLSTRSVVRNGGYLELRVAQAIAPWLAASPREAFAALDAYERFWEQKLETVGPLFVSELRQTWKSSARREVRKRLREKDGSAVTLVHPPVQVPRGSKLSVELESP
jgi:hypothetical protein